MPKYKRKSTIVDAEQYFEGKNIQGMCVCWKLIQPHIHEYLDGEMIVRRLNNGEWVITEIIDGYVFQSTMSDERFKREYEENN